MRRRTTLLFALVGAIFALASPGGARAHANLERSEPPANAVIPAAPAQVALFFSEQPEPKFTHARLLSASGPVLDDATLTIVGSEEVTFPIPTLSDGTYTVVWRTVSSVDGHPTQGAFSFTIGAPGQFPPAPPPVRSTPAGPPRWLQALGKWLTFIAFAELLGLTVVAPVLRRGDSNRIRPVRAEIATVAALLVVSATVAVYLQAWAADGSPGSLFGSAGRTLLADTRFGHAWILRAILSLSAIGLLAWQPPSPHDRRADFRRAAATIASGGVVLSVSLNGHFTAESGTGGWVVDWLHLLGATIWTGGLLQLALAVRNGSAQGPRPLSIRRFSPLAFAAVATLLVTGVLIWWVLEGDLSDTFETAYGRTLLVKLALLLPALALGAFHFLSGRSTRFSASARSSALEAALALSVIGAAALLASTPPPDTVAAVPPGTMVVRSGDLQVALAVQPAIAGRNRLTFDLRELAGKHGAVEQFIVRTTYLDDILGISEDQATGGPDRYILEGGQLSLPGKWEIDVVIRRIGEDDILATFQVTVAK